MNNREIKFRFWNEAEKKYFIPFIGARIDLGLTYFETHIKCAYPEQFTGLKDKNGKDIYEGDILKFTTYSESGITKKDHPAVAIRWNNSKSTYDFYDNKNRCLGDYPFFHYWTLENMRNEELEIIGNIHENHELLTK